MKKDVPLSDLCLTRNARSAEGGRVNSGAGWRHQSFLRAELSRGLGMEPAGVDWRKIRGARSRDGLAASRSRRTAPGAEISGGQPLAHREEDAARNVRVAARPVGANAPNRARPQPSRALP